MPLSNLQLLAAAQASALKAVEAAADPFATIQAQVADFAATGNPGTDWISFNQSYLQAKGQYSGAAQRDAAKAKAATAPGSPAPNLTGLPPALAALITGKTAAPAAPAAAAAAPAPAAPAPAAPAAPANAS